MGSLYYGHKKCGMGVAIYGTYVGFVRCDKCKTYITHDKNPAFQHREYECDGCEARVSFDSMGHTTCDCLVCEKPMKDVAAVARGRPKRKRAAPAPVAS